MEAVRSSLSITLSVWKALFLREAVTRLSTGRAAWLWLLLEPMMHVAYLVFIYTVIRIRAIGGIETPVWIIVGLIAYFMFRRTAVQGMIAVTPNRALFAYRQVKPADAVLVRAGLEGALTAAVALLILFGAALASLRVTPDDPLLVLTALVGVWLTGLGFGLVASVASELVPELGRVINLAMTPLYFLSGVIFPIARIPAEYRDWVLWNPLVHGLEGARLGFATYYEPVPGVDLGYLYAVALAMIFAGLVLHRRFATRLLAT